MTLPELPTDGPSPGEWARHVKRHEPHGLDVLEAHVLAYATQADEFTNTPWYKHVWSFSTILLGLFASIGGFAAVFGSPRDIRIGRTDAPDANDLPFASICYIVAVVGVILLAIEWFKTGRRRHPGIRRMLVWIFVFGVLGVLVAAKLASDEGVPLGLWMAPAYVMMALAVVLFLLTQFSPRPDPEPEKPRVLPEQLTPKGMRMLMQSRNTAIDVFAERRLLPDVDVKVLKARPLGRLHLEDGPENDETPG